MMPVGIIVYDNNNNVIFSNQIAADALRTSARLLTQISAGQSFEISVGDKTYAANRVDIDDGAIGFFVILSDISHWRNEIAEQKEQIHELEDIFNSSYDELFVIDGNGLTKRI
ncbi:MAG TPA: transcriptional regulator, partial [Pelotomaculum sp.]|nr:transcriptional regulator [Pelotomaculum sp.]